MTATPNPALALVVTNERHMLQRFFPGQARVAAELGVPIVISDNASTDGSVAYARETSGAANLVVVENGSNLGYAGAVNSAFAAVPGRDVFVINADIELESAEDVTALAAVLAADDGTAVVAPQLIEPDGGVQASARSFPTPVAMAGNSSALRRLPAFRRAAAAYTRPPSGAEPVEVDWAIGAALLIRRRAYDEVGGWDDRYRQYMEDADFCLVCRQAGWKTVYVPAVSLRHVYPQASSDRAGGFFGSPARRRHIRSMLQFFAKHPRLALPRRARGNKRASG